MEALRLPIIRFFPQLLVTASLTTKPLFSILVPTYNQAQFLGTALDSLQAQTWTNWEAVVVNDGSSDSTPQLLARYAEADPRIRPIHKENGGVGSALNTALENAQGQWICWLSSDDLFDHRKLQIHTEGFEQFPDCQFFYTPSVRLLNETGELNLEALDDDQPIASFQVLKLLCYNYISGISICIDRSLLLEAKGFRPQLKYAQDYDCWLRILARHPAQFLPEATSFSRVHPGQDSADFIAACFYDSLCAATELLNKYSLTELVKGAKEQTVTPLTIFNNAVDVAMNIDMFLNRVAMHPALPLKILRYAQKQGNPALRADLVTRAAKTSRLRKKKSHGFLWAMIGIAAGLPELQVDEAEIDPIVLLRRYYPYIQRLRPGVAKELHRYLDRFHKPAPSLPDRSPRDERNCVLIIPASGINESIEALLEQLYGFGLLVAMIQVGEASLSCHKSTLLLKAPSDTDWAKLSSGLYPFDLVLDLSQGEFSKLPPARKTLSLKSQVISEAELLDAIENAKKNNLRLRTLILSTRRKLEKTTRQMGSGEDRQKSKELYFYQPQKDWQFPELDWKERPADKL